MTTISFLEGATGLALMTFPSFVSVILLGSSLTDPKGIVIAREQVWSCIRTWQGQHWSHLRLHVGF